MRLYSVHLRHNGRHADRDLVLVKEGFSWPAALFTVFWALAHRMWWVAMGVFALFTLVGAVLVWLGVGETADGLITIALMVGVGMVGNDLRRWSLSRADFLEVAMVSGKNVEDATRRFLDEAEITPAGVFA